VRIPSALWILALACSTNAVAAPIPPSADEILNRARATLASSSYPAHLSYVIAVSVNDHGVTKTRHYTAFYDDRRGLIDTRAISSEEGVAQPTTGSKLYGAILTHGHTLKRPINAQVDDYLGVPILAPNYTFGLVRPISPPTGTINVDTSPLKQIGRVVSSTVRYRATLVGTEPAEGRSAYHLALTPVRDPHLYRLRDLWVDGETFDVLKLRTDGNFTAQETAAIPWTVTFGRVGDAVYIKRETADAPLVFTRAHTYDDVTLTFEGIAPLTTPPIRLLTGTQSLQELREP